VPFALNALLTDALRLDVAVGYADAHFVGNSFDQSGRPLAENGNTVGLLPQVNAPWNVNVRGTYSIPVTSGGTIKLTAENHYNSRNPGPFITQIPTSPVYNPLLTPDPATDITNARFSYAYGKLDTALFVNNVFNAHPLLGTFQYLAETKLITNTTFRPRTIGLAVNWHF
jgi:iron complex outermembrane recepter protein